MEDLYVDVDAEIVDSVTNDVADAEDEFIDAKSVIVSRSYGSDNGGRRVIRYDAYNRPINDKPSDYVSFRYSRHDRYEGTKNYSGNQVMEKYRKAQSAIDAIYTSRQSVKQKRASIRLIVNEFHQYLRSQNIRYRNLWRNLDTHGIVPSKQIW
jgi:hypothetical protein